MWFIKILHHISVVTTDAWSSIDNTAGATGQCSYLISHLRWQEKLTLEWLYYVMLQTANNNKIIRIKNTSLCHETGRKFWKSRGKRAIILRNARFPYNFTMLSYCTTVCQLETVRMISHTTFLSLLLNSQPTVTSFIRFLSFTVVQNA